ncbi:MAG: hypothetical protein KF873_04085 [Gemmataceae bacterium]|nr:hypothetical protein [Gemmataceae bacterium]
MHAKIRLWHVLAIAILTAIGYWTYSGLPSPPDYTQEGFTSIHVVFPGKIEFIPTVTATSSDPTLIAELTNLLRTGKSVMVCRCGYIGNLEFRRPDGSTEVLNLVPAHDDGSVEYRNRPGRFRVNRKEFLRIVKPLGVPEERWIRFPDFGIPDEPTPK